MELNDLIISSLIAFGLSIILVGLWIRFIEEKLKNLAKEDKLVYLKMYFGKDMNKPEEHYAARYGGLWTVVSIVFGYLILEAYHVYLNHGTYYITELFSIATLMLLGALVGLIDDLSKLPVKHRLLASALISLPLATVKAGVSTMSFPIIGQVNLGIYYSLLLVPIGVMGASNAYNILAGYNGLEACMGIIIFSGYAIYSLHHGHILAAKLSIIAVAGLIGFLYWNKYPAKTFPGNTFTYAIGSLIAAIVIIGNFEKFGVSIFLLYFLELILFIRGLMNGIYKQNFGIPERDGSLKLPYDKIYSVTHLAIYILHRLRGRATEKGVVALITLIQTIITIIALIVTW